MAGFIRYYKAYRNTFYEAHIAVLFP